jgi:GNAT superfamily N-acetyltransferase
MRVELHPADAAEAAPAEPVIAPADNRADVLTLYREMLETVAQYGEDAGRAEAMVDRIMWPAAQAGEAVLLARIAGRLAGGIFWVRDLNPESAWHGAAVAWGTYVRPEYRRRHLSVALRRAGLARLRELGVARMYGAFHEGNEAGRKSGAAWGFKPFQRLEVLDL